MLLSLHSSSCTQYFMSGNIDIDTKCLDKLAPIVMLTTAKYSLLSSLVSFALQQEIDYNLNII